MTHVTKRSTTRWWSQSLTVVSLTAVCLTGGPLTAVAGTTTTADRAATTTTKSKPKADESIDSWMPNKRLQETVLKDLKDDNPNKEWQSVSEITKDDMQLLKSLHDTQHVYIDGKTEYSLEGLQYATNLERLTLGGDLNYHPVRLNADIVDVTPLKDLQSLKVLNLQYNRLKDVSPLAGLKNVTQMSLGWNYIEDFSMLPISQYEQFTYTDQFIERPTVNISAKTRSAHLKVALKFKSSTPVELEAPSGYARLSDWTPDDKIFRSYYFNGGTGTPDGQGGLKFTDIVDQEPGPTELPGQNVTPLPDKFYLLGKDKDGIFKVAQPYKLAAEAKPVTVKYQDQDGKSLHDDIVLEGVVGDHYITEQLELPGHTFKEVKGAAQGEFSDQAQTVTYVYTKDPVKAQAVTVKYQDENGKSLRDDIVLNGNVGDDYTTERLTLPGYTFKEIKGEPQGKLGDQAQTVTYVYTKDREAGKPITVKYVSTTGEEIAPDVTLNGDTGAPYEAERLDIPGYEWTKAEGNEKGTFGDQAHTITMIYTPIEGDGGSGNGSDGGDTGGNSSSSSSSSTDSSSDSSSDASSDSSSNSSSSSSTDSSSNTNSSSGSDSSSNSSSNSGSSSNSSSNPDSSSSSSSSSSSNSSSNSDSSSSSSSDSSSSSSSTPSTPTPPTNPGLGTGSGSDSSSNSSSGSSSDTSSSSSSSSSSSTGSSSHPDSSSDQPTAPVTDEQDDDVTGGPGTIGPAGPFEGGLDSDQPGGSTGSTSPFENDLTPTVFPTQGTTTIDGDLPQTNEQRGRLGAWLGAALLVTVGLTWFSRRSRQK